MVLVTFCYPFRGTFVQLTKNNVVTARANSMSCADRVLRLIKGALFSTRLAGGGPSSNKVVAPWVTKITLSRAAERVKRHCSADVFELLNPGYTAQLNKRNILFDPPSIVNFRPNVVCIA